MQMNYMDKSNKNPNMEPEYRVPYGSPTPIIKAQRNISLLEFYEVVANAWSLTDPEILIVPYAENHIFDPEKGYIVYNLDRKRTMENFIKPRLRESVCDPDDPTNIIQIWVQAFTHTIEYSAMHKNPKVAEAILENFEDFMTVLTPKFIEFGVQDFVYGQRPSDRHLNRNGDDMSMRTVMYVVNLQKLFFGSVARIEEIWGRAIVMTEKNTVLHQYATPNTDQVHLDIVDTYTYATPS